jgi:AhpD family alkylhydroperoxidase
LALYLTVYFRDIAVIAASIAGGCSPCLDSHFKKAIEIGCTPQQAMEAVELGKMIKQRPVKDIYEQAEKLIAKYADGDNDIKQFYF